MLVFPKTDTLSATVARVIEPYPRLGKKSFYGSLFLAVHLYGSQIQVPQIPLRQLFGQHPYGIIPHHEAVRTQYGKPWRKFLYVIGGQVQISQIRQARQFRHIPAQMVSRQNKPFQILELQDLLGNFLQPFAR